MTDQPPESQGPLQDRWIASSVAMQEEDAGPRPQVVASLRTASSRLAFALVLLGAAVLAGWVAGVGALTRAFPGLVTMKVNIAAGFVLVGLSLRALARPGAAGTRRALIGAGAVGAMALATLAEYASGRSLGIDDPLGFDAGTRVPGRMAVMAAVCFSLLALSVAALARGRYRLGQAAGAAVLAIAALAGTGYLFDVRGLARELGVGGSRADGWSLRRQ